jgi:hypothetical protein
MAAQNLERFMVYRTIPSNSPCVILAPGQDGNLVVEAVERRGRELYERERREGTPYHIHGGLTGLPRFIAEAVEEGWVQVGDLLPKVLEPEAGLEFAGVLSERISEYPIDKVVNMQLYFSQLQKSRNLALQIPEGDNPAKYADRKVA